MSPRSEKGSWTELSNECAGSKSGRVLPDLDHSSFRIDKDIERRLKEENLIYDSFMEFPADLFGSKLDKFITNTKDTFTVCQLKKDQGQLAKRPQSF